MSFNVYPPIGGPASGSSALPMSNTPSSSSNPRESYSYPTSSQNATQMSSASYSNPQGQAWTTSTPASASSSTPSSSYIASSQNAWMNWSANLPVNSTSDPPLATKHNTTTSAASSSTYDANRIISYGFPYMDIPPSAGPSTSNAVGTTYLDQKDKDFESKFLSAAFAAPAINLGTGDRFSQLLEAKMSMMSGMSNAQNTNSEYGSMTAPIPTAQPQQYDYRLQEFPIQAQDTNPVNPYPTSAPMSSANPNMHNANPLPISPTIAKSFQHVLNPPDPHFNSTFITPNRFTAMNMPPPPPPQVVPDQSTSLRPADDTSIASPYVTSTYGNMSRPVDDIASFSAIQTPWLQGMGGFGGPPPPPPQREMPSLSPVTSSNTRINTPYTQYTQQGGSRLLPEYAHRSQPVFDPLAIEKHLSDWSQTQIQPDLVAPLPDPVQYYNRQRSPTSSQGDGSTYIQSSAQSQGQARSNFLPIEYPHPQAQSSSAPPSINPSSPVTHLAPLPASAPTSVRSSKSPINPSAPAPQRQIITGWSSNAAVTPKAAPNESSSRIKANAVAAEENLPPVLKIRVKKSNSIDKGSTASYPAPGLVKKTPNPPKAVSGNLTSAPKGTKFSFSTSINKADLALKSKRKKDNTAQELDEEKEHAPSKPKHNESGVSRKKRKTASKDKEAEPQKTAEPPLASSNEDKAAFRTAPSTKTETQCLKTPIDKTVIACNNCRAKKLKCNGEKPKCFHCHRRGEDTCVYEAILRRRGPGKHNKEKPPKEAKEGKKRKSTASTQENEDHSSNEHDSEDDGDQDDNEEGNKSIRKASSDNGQTQPVYESFGLGGGGEMGRIDSRRLNEDELQNMTYILKKDKDQDNSFKDNSTPKTILQSGTEKGNGNPRQGVLGMGFGHNLNTQNLNLLGSGSRFELSTARD
ncbi:uncharacterized protein I303_100521 [Kwoniella dejecticola CBS 10117]|uniref:Zn(2)-C6 fungal-type domain-containing protein n=1 Tax=Kwoniella dejecticola CBS 10117 TaxID=1296121 RepID=A0A1A6AF77_9TREE|nr:uncharacterized protein I303_00521 [Kwoniella dejecticola CBS 10117]OBR88704.1 hypothetical protein I303_00521 [Kwoniella dejecticola CBS 10117]